MASAGIIALAVVRTGSADVTGDSPFELIRCCSTSAVTSTYGTLQNQLMTEHVLCSQGRDGTVKLWPLDAAGSLLIRRDEQPTGLRHGRN